MCTLTHTHTLSLSHTHTCICASIADALSVEAFSVHRLFVPSACVSFCRVFLLLHLRLRVPEPPLHTNLENTLTHTHAHTAPWIYSHAHNTQHSGSKGVTINLSILCPDAVKASRRIAITCATETLTGLEAAAEVWLHPPNQPPERSLCPPWTRLGSALAAQRTIVLGISVCLSTILRSSSQHDLPPVLLPLLPLRVKPHTDCVYMQSSTGLSQQYEFLKCHGNTVTVFSLWTSTEPPCFPTSSALGPNFEFYLPLIYMAVDVFLASLYANPKHRGTAQTSRGAKTC